MLRLKLAGHSVLFSIVDKNDFRRRIVNDKARLLDGTGGVNRHHNGATFKCTDIGTGPLWAVLRQNNATVLHLYAKFDQHLCNFTANLVKGLPAHLIPRSGHFKTFQRYRVF